MSRPIKFRMWDEKEKVMIDGDSLAFEEYAPICELLSQDGIMQFTGLNDKNGKEIYEGDIWSVGRSTGEIIYAEDGFKIQWIVDKNFYNDILRNHNKFGEVIGNIYENPSLSWRYNHERTT